ncbi:MAG: VWA domain-containing protein [Spirochaetales bacterium]|nr:VWA domain-containing protein [Spirochaetales bacterium]
MFFTIEGIKKIEKIKWREIEPGMIFLGGILINDTVPYELRGFPVLTAGLIEELKDRYRFLYERDILVARVYPGIRPVTISRRIRDGEEFVQKLNAVRSSYFSEKKIVFEKASLTDPLDKPLSETECVNPAACIKDRYNSFTLPFTPGSSTLVPSLFKNPDTVVSLGHLLSRGTSLPFSLPRDRKVLLHCVVDYSGGVKEKENWDAVNAALRFLHTRLVPLLKGTELRLYAFSDECKPLFYPLSGREIPQKERRYASFIKKVLHHKDRDICNKIILFTDGLPDDRADTFHYIGLFKKNRIDYTQLVFGGKERGAERQYIEAATEIADAACGNQYIIADTSCTSPLTAELYDRYLGLLNLLETPSREEKSRTEAEQKESGLGTQENIHKKKITKWRPPVIKREK